MDAYFSYLNKLVNDNKTKFARYPEIKWINPYEAGELQQIRDHLIENQKESLLFKGTKPFYKQISDGCMLCGKGLWSCLFITGKCNANCFYCPSAQVSDDLPTSQGLTFPTAESYAEYISYFGFKSVSFSGGEPLLVSDRVLAYLKQIRKQCSEDIYTWMYTNGILANETIFKQLSELGLNEVRFDIGATSYKLDKIKYAKGIINNITIEIPAIPEEKEQLKALLPEMIKSGVSNLNLHQLRLTEFNASKLLKRDYTYIPAERPIVLESELAALEILEYARKQQLEIGVNYCSFFFKNRFQSSGFRRQIASELAPEDSIISEKGYARKIHSDSIQYQSIRITNEGNLPVPSSLVLPNKSYDYTTETVKVIRIDNKESHHQFQNLILQEPVDIPSEQDLFDIWQHEYIEKGLREY